MAISLLQQQGFVNMPQFQQQVAAVVKTFALYLDNQNPDMDQGNQNILANIIRSPSSYSFAEAIVSDPLWDKMFDEWAADPTTYDAVIEQFIQPIFGLLTQYNYVKPQALVSTP